ncbi:MAG: hypothetical protein R3336_08755, partial [Phycisphaeraceae bacterium]|nr:hypothetical protein [Phycisphaeraceae bacterium]
MLRSLTIPAVVVYALSLLATALVTSPPAEPPADPSPASASPPVRPLPDRPLIGFSIDLHHTDHLPRYHAAIDQLADRGFNAVQILTPIFQRDIRSNRIHRLTGPGRGPTQNQLVALLRHARRRGLHTTLMPVVLLTHPRGNEWRGRINPQQWDRWWASYHRCLLDFAHLAAAEDVTLLCIGSELLTTEDQIGRWQTLVSDIRTKFPGPISYSTNWDHYPKTRLWPLVDVIGVNGYWDLTVDGGSIDQPAGLTRRWETIRDRLLAFADQHQRPLLLTEVG